MLDRVSKYMELMNTRPNLFLQNERIRLVLDESKIRKFEAESGKPMGIVYDNSPFYMVIADLCEGKNGLYSYARVVSCNPKSSGTVAIPYCNGYFGLLTIFRHAPRKEMLEFPRGFSENLNLTVEQNIRKELSEEIGVDPESCKISSLGQVFADSGLASGCADLFVAEFETIPETVLCQEEGISKFKWYSEKQIKTMIANNEITDGFTLSAYAKYICLR